jgi:hypothetical protein
VFVGVLPLMSSNSEKRAFIGALLSIFSLIYYRESEPFLQQSTNVLAYTAQYSTFFTFVAALIVENNILGGVNPFLFGLVMVAGNLLVVFVVLVASYKRYDSQRTVRHETKARKAQSVEWACGFSAAKFQVLVVLFLFF